MAASHHLDRDALDCMGIRGLDDVEGLTSALLRIAESVVGQDAEDVLQDVWVRLLGQPLRTDPEHPHAFLYQTIRYQAMDARRHDTRLARREEEHGRNGLALESILTPVELAAIREDADQLELIVAALPTRQRQVLRARIAQDLIEEIARSLGLSRTAVRSNLNRARVRVDQEWTRLQRGDASTNHGPPARGRSDRASPN